MIKSLRQEEVKIWKVQTILNVSELVLQKIRKRNRFSILDTNDDNDIDNEPETNFVDGVSNIQPLYEMLNNSAKNGYDIKIVSSN